MNEFLAVVAACAVMATCSVGGYAVGYGQARVDALSYPKHFTLESAQMYPYTKSKEPSP